MLCCAGEKLVFGPRSGTRPGLCCSAGVQQGCCQEWTENSFFYRYLLEPRCPIPFRLLDSCRLVVCVNRYHAYNQSCVNCWLGDSKIGVGVLCTAPSPAGCTELLFLSSIEPHRACATTEVMRLGSSGMCVAHVSPLAFRKVLVYVYCVYLVSTFVALVDCILRNSRCVQQIGARSFHILSTPRVAH